MASAVGRRDGAPRTTSTAAPANQPTSTASTESNDAGDARNRVMTRPVTATQPHRRHGRLSHGALAVRAAASAAMPSAVGTPGW